MFKKGSGKKNLVGLDIGSSSVKTVELGKKGAALQLLNLGFLVMVSQQNGTPFLFQVENLLGEGFGGQHGEVSPPL